MRWEESPLSSTTPHFFPPKEKTVNVKKEKRWISPRDGAVSKLLEMVVVAPL
jgi:hypothetical protein